MLSCDTMISHHSILVNSCVFIDAQGNKFHFYKKNYVNIVMLRTVTTLITVTPDYVIKVKILTRIL